MSGNRPGLSTKALGYANRFRVFSFVKKFMEAEGISPLPKEVAVALDLSEVQVREHMRALEGASGLPMPIKIAGRGGRMRDVWEVYGDEMMAGRVKDLTAIFNDE